MNNEKDSKNTHKNEVNNTEICTNDKITNSEENNTQDTSES